MERALALPFELTHLNQAAETQAALQQLNLYLPYKPNHEKMQSLNIEMLDAPVLRS